MNNCIDLPVGCLITVINIIPPRKVIVLSKIVIIYPKECFEKFLFFLFVFLYPYKKIVYNVVCTHTEEQSHTGLELHDSE